jgi:acyl carrier protein
MDWSQLVKASIARRAFQPASRISDDTDLGKLAIDSFALVELLVELEQAHGIRLSVDDLQSLRTVRDLTSLVASARGR